MRYCLEYSWPGNVRELENAMERMVLLSKGDELTAADLPDAIRAESDDGEERIRHIRQENDFSLAEMEKQMILHALKHWGGNQTQAARHLGLSRRTLAYRLEKYGIYGDKLKALKQEGN